MNEIENLKHALHTRISGNPDDYFTDSLWEEEVNSVCCDLEESIRFIQTECSDEELYWLGEVFDDIMDKSRSVAFLNALRERAKRVENPQWRAEVEEDLRTAAEYIDED